MKFLFIFYFFSLATVHAVTPLEFVIEEGPTFNKGFSKKIFVRCISNDPNEKCKIVYQGSDSQRQILRSELMSEVEEINRLHNKISSRPKITSHKTLRHIELKSESLNYSIYIGSFTLYQKKFAKDYKTLTKRIEILRDLLLQKKKK